MQKLPTLRTTPDEAIYQRHNRDHAALTNRKKYRAFRNGLLSQRKREALLGNRSVCVDCASDGRTYDVIPVDGHHIQPKASHPERLYDHSNIEFVCKRHHGMRNQHEAVQHIRNRYVVYGAPGVGKTTFVQNRVGYDAIVWDADEQAAKLGYSSFPRTERQTKDLQWRREQWVLDAMRASCPVWVIVRWSVTAWICATRLRAAHVIRLTTENRDKIELTI